MPFQWPAPSENADAFDPVHQVYWAVAESTLWTPVLNISVNREQAEKIAELFMELFPTKRWGIGPKYENRLTEITQG